MKFVRTSVSLTLAAMLSATAWAAESPIGALVIKGKATIVAQDTSFALQDQEYAYFPSDRIETGEKSRAMLNTSDGLKVAFGQDTVARIDRDNGAYVIDLQQGAMAVDARKGIDYSVTKNGETVSGGEKFIAGDEPYVASVTDGEDVKFYMPAQLDVEGKKRGAIWWLLGAVGGVVGGTVIYNNVIKDDSPPSS